jgi:V/A-type H+/Na+-transporting ATPase subunit C
MDKIIFTQIVPRLRVLENKLLDRTKIERMIDSGTPEEALKVLSESEYSSSVSALKRAQDYEKFLSEELERVYKLLQDISPVKEPVEIMSLKYDYHNIKVLLKGKALKKDLESLLIKVGTVPVEKLQQYIENEEYRDLGVIMREAVEKAESQYKASKDPQVLDIILDNYMFSDMLYRAKDLNDDYIVNYVRIYIDLINIKTLLRVRKQGKDREFLRSVIVEGGKIDKDVFFNSLGESLDSFAGKIAHTDYYSILKQGLEEYSKSGKINVFEKLSENFVMDYMKKAKFVSFGAEPIVAYLIAKETEIKTIRIIMVGKLNKVAPELIRERLRDIYV